MGLSVAKRYLPTIHYTVLTKEMHKIKYYKSSNQLLVNDVEEIDEKTQFMTPAISVHSTIEMLTPLKPSTKSAQIKKLFAAMVMVGKLQRIRNRNMVRREMRERAEREKEEEIKEADTTKSVASLVFEASVRYNHIICPDNR